MSGAVSFLWIIVTVMTIINIFRGQQIRELETRIEKLEGKKDAE